MLLLRAEGIKKIYGDRVVLDIDNLSLYTGDRIGVVGANGAGKTTLFELLAGSLAPDDGQIECFGTMAYCRQFQNDITKKTDTENYMQTANTKESSIWRTPDRVNTDGISGGELMRQKLAEVFSGKSHMLLLDEPTANLDSEGIQTLAEQLKKVQNVRPHLGAPQQKKTHGQTL